VNSSNSLKKEKKNNASSSQNLNKSKLLMKNNNISSDILTDILKGIISLKNNNLFDYIIKMLKLILYYYKGNNIISRNSYINELNSDDSTLNILYKNIFEMFSKEINIRQLLMNDFNNNKNFFKNIHFVFIFYLFSGIEYIKDIINEDGVKKFNININNYIDYNQLLNILLLFMNKEKCHLNENKNKNNKCIICSKLNKINEFNFNKNIYKTIEKSIDTNININLKSNDKSTFNINEKIIFDYNQKHIKNKYKMKKNMSNINSDISLKMLKSSYTNKSLKKNANKSNQNIHTTNKSNDKRFMNYLKTTFDDKIKNNILYSHREYETGISNGNKIYSEWKNYISKDNNKSTNKNNKNDKKVYNYSYKKNNIINLSYKNNIKDYNSLQNFFSRKNQEKKLTSKKKKLNSNINISNNHQIFFYPKVEQFLNNVYIINDNNKNTNDKVYKEKEEKLKENIIDTKQSKEGLSKEKQNITDILKKEDNTNDIFNYMNIISSQINSMENIFDNFKAQTMKIKQEMLEIENKNKLK